MKPTILTIWVAVTFSSFLTNQALAIEIAPIKQEVINKDKTPVDGTRPLGSSNVVSSVNSMDILPVEVAQKNGDEDGNEKIAETKQSKNFFVNYFNSTQSLIYKGVDFLVPASPDKEDSLMAKYKKAKDSVLNQGMQYIGIKYKWGGNDEETGFDCSGLVQAVFQNSIGMALPRTAMEMSKVGKHVGTMDNLKPGDLVFFNTLRRKFSHVGIYMGDNKFLHAPRKGAEVRVEEIGASYWKKRFNGATRLEINAGNPPEM